jgi:hypothetical protein
MIFIYSINNDIYSINNDIYSINKDIYSINNDIYSINNDIIYSNSTWKKINEDPSYHFEGTENDEAYEV